MDKSNAFLTDAQTKAIAEVRDRIGLKSFEIMFAVHRFVCLFRGHTQPTHGRGSEIFAFLLFFPLKKSKKRKNDLTAEADAK